MVAKTGSSLSSLVLERRKHKKILIQWISWSEWWVNTWNNTERIKENVVTRTVCFPTYPLTHGFMVDTMHSGSSMTICLEYFLCPVLSKENLHSTTLRVCQVWVRRDRICVLFWFPAVDFFDTNLFFTHLETI
jgi:hypothetical protein